MYIRINSFIPYSLIATWLNNVFSDQTLQSRRIRIEVSNSSNDERRGGRMGRDNRRDGGFEDSEQRTSGDWRSGPRDDGPSDGDRYRSRGGFENRDRDRDRKEEREGKYIKRYVKCPKCFKVFQ